DGLLRTPPDRQPHQGPARAGAVARPTAGPAHHRSHRGGAASRRHAAAGTPGRDEGGALLQPRRPRPGGCARGGDTPVLAWADDPVDAFFLEIQGSGRLQLRDGSTMRVGYADQNGHPYRAIGKTLIDRGALTREQVTAPAIRRWLQENPAAAPGVMNTNPSLVFFRQLPPPADPTLGPPGSLGVPLTPLRSIAVDRSRIPLGSLVYLQTTHPVSGQPLERLMVAQ